MHELLLRLSEPFAPDAIVWKPGTLTKEGNKCMAMAYADLRVYQSRLDEVCGLDWSCRYVPWSDGRIICELTIGGVTRSSTGEMDAQDEKNGMGGTVAEAQAMKRAASQFGLGRYLYDLPSVWVDFDPQRKRITDAGLKELENRYAAWYVKKKASAKASSALGLVGGKEDDDGAAGMGQQGDKPKAVATNGVSYHADEVWTPRETVKAADALSTVQATRIERLGVDVYGENFAAEAERLALWASNQKVNVIARLNAKQAAVLIAGLEKKLTEKVAA